jgi:hypothetical protein
MVNTANQHPWVIAAPWWHWPKVAQSIGEADGVAMQPVLQKYAASSFVNDLLADPQSRLAYFPGRDTALDETGHAQRKVYLTTHHRHYAVLASLHCDVDSLPAVNSDAVCDVGFVVRRTTSALTYSPTQQGRDNLLRLITRVRAARQQLGNVEAQQQQLKSRGNFNTNIAAGRRAAAEELLQRRETDLAVARNQFPTSVQGWFRSPTKPGFGLWQNLGDDTPEELLVDEATFPLYRIAPPTQTHDCVDTAIWFGMVPDGSSETDANAQSRFDDHSTYEIRVFVRRHDPRCPKKRPCCCGGELTWSSPSSAYRLAHPLDLRGTSNRPVNISLPNLDALRKDALEGFYGGMTMKMPTNFSVDDEDQTFTPKSGVADECTFSIPLLTIIAMFVFRLFLPIVVFILQLWWMLLLKFCLPKGDALSFELSDADLTVEQDAELDIAINAAFEFDGPPNQSPAKRLRVLFSNSTPEGRQVFGTLATAGTRQNVTAADPPSWVSRVERDAVRSPQFHEVHV